MFPGAAILWALFGSTLQTRILRTLLLLTHAEYTRIPPPDINSLGTPRATVSPSAAPYIGNNAVEQELGFRSGKVTGKAADRCVAIGEPPPIERFPVVVTDPETFTSPLMF